jgi:hypothetical protein
MRGIVSRPTSDNRPTRRRPEKKREAKANKCSPETATHQSDNPTLLRGCGSSNTEYREGEKGNSDSIADRYFRVQHPYRRSISANRTANACDGV